MSIKKLSVIFIILIIILPSISSNAVSSETEDDSTSSDRPIIDALLWLRFRLGWFSSLAMGRYFTRQLKPPIPIQAYPDAVSINYLNKTTVEIGGKDDEGLRWKSMVELSGNYDWSWMTPRTVISFEFVPPENAAEDVWIVEFNPEEIVMDTNRENFNWPGAEDPFKTNVSIMLKPSADPTFPTQDVVLKVNIVREEIIDKRGIRKGLPKAFRTHLDDYLEKSEALGIEDKYLWFDTAGERLLYNAISRWFIWSLNIPLPYYEKWVDTTVEILIRVDKYHQAELIPPLPLDIEPYQVKSIPVTIKNLGSHIDTFNFRVKCNDENIIVTPPPALTLKPGEEAEALVGVAAPRRFLSVGSTTSIFVEAYSVDDPEAVFSNTVILSISGIHTTGSATYNFVSMIITLVIALMIILYLLRRRREKILKKPDKPWDLPEEKEHLEKLKEKDKKEYNDTLDRMEEEYKSALLWYNSYIAATLQKKRVTKKDKEPKKKKEKFKFITKLFEVKKEKKVKKEKEPKKKKEKSKFLTYLLEDKKEKKVKKEKSKFLTYLLEDKKEKKPLSVKKKEEKQEKIDKQAEKERRRKEKALLKIKHEQEKQKRKMQV